MRSLGLCAGLCLALAAPARAEKPAKVDLKTYQVPYRLTKTQHILVRVKINGKGPFNLILDTGAPALFVSTKAAKKAGVEPDAKGWGTFDKFEVEGGVSIPKAKGRVEDPFQLEGMNGLGLAGAELHGMIGYTLLAHYRIEIDLTKDKMTWTELDFDPPAPKRLDGAKGGTAGLDALGGIMKLAGGLLGRKAKPEIIARGFLGMELAESDGKVTVRGVLEQGPAAKAGIKTGDQIAEYDGQKVKNDAGLLQLASHLTSGKEVKLTVIRDGKRQTIAVTAGEGL
jgi:serine protease DegQ